MEWCWGLIFTAVMASIGTAGVPSVGLVTLTMVFNSVGLSVEAIGVIFGIDHILDMFRTAVNLLVMRYALLLSHSETRPLILIYLMEKKNLKNENIYCNIIFSFFSFILKH